MKIAQPEAIRNMDKTAIEKYGIPGILLMENAARQVALEVMTLHHENEGAVVFLAGPGNNGGDAFAAARHVILTGCPVSIITTVPLREYKNDAKINLDILIKLGINPLEQPETGIVNSILCSCNILVDGIYGTGLHGDVAGYSRQIIELSHGFSGKIVSIDIPSGIDGRTGQVLGDAVKADITVTFALGKPGLYLHPGASYSGKVRIADISLPMTLDTDEASFMDIIDHELVSSWLPKHSPSAHKGQIGSVLTIAGSKGMTGAAVLSAAGALRSGAGLVRAVMPSSIMPIMNTLVPEVIGLPLSSLSEHWTADAADDIWPVLPNVDAVLIGPGIPVNGETSILLDRFLEESADIPLVLDAGALGILATDKSISHKLSGHVVLTPHLGEMSRLTGITVQEIKKDMVKAALDLSNSWGVVVVLKGAGTVVACPDGEVFINTTGNSGMATAGSGDVLSGIIVSLMAQGLEPKKAAVCGVWIHGAAGDFAAGSGSKQAMIASDIVANIGQVYLAFNQN